MSKFKNITLDGSFSIVWKSMFASKYSLCKISEIRFYKIYAR